ncbi:MAG: arginine--tRNA ligase [Candidatus Aminicenantaceae bacterium]
MYKLKNKIRKKISKDLKEKFSTDLIHIEISYTPHIKMGDLALTYPFQLAKKLKRSPRQIADESIPLLSSLPSVQKVEVAKGGYINLFLKRKIFFSYQLKNLRKTSLFPEEKKIVIEHTNINPNKAAHIGHLRNACLGDALSRCLKYKGETVEIQNYIDDTGIQVVDVVLGFIDLEKKSLTEIKKIKGKFDYYCWDLYTKVSSFLENHPDFTRRRSEILKKIEKGENPEYEIAHYISRRILLSHLNTMKRIDISYDLLPCESDILKLKFWEKAFKLLKEKNAIFFSPSGSLKGCWAMKFEEEADRDKIIVRSDGTVTYVGKDIAYQLWKFGLLEKDFYYEPFTEINGNTIWITSSFSNHKSPQFGKASKVYNVIDIRQSFLQKIVSQSLRALGYKTQAKKSIHFSYEMVALSPKSLEEINIPLQDEEKEKEFHEVSGRKGLGIKADDLLDRLEEKAFIEVEKRNPDIGSDLKRDISHKIAASAIRYFMLKFTKNSLIIFDFDEALSFEGETGPYLQYTYVRINSIFRKLKAKEGTAEKNIQQWISSQDIPWKALPENEERDFWELVLFCSQLEEEILHSIHSLEISHLAKFTFNLCQKFNGYYHKYSVLAEKNIELKKMRILCVYFVKNILKDALFLMGIPLPEKM